MKYIDAEELLKAQFRAEEYNQETGDYDLPVVAVADIKAMPAANVIPARYGEWAHSEGGEAHCSECGCTVYGAELSPYCPQCGAKMDVETP